MPDARSDTILVAVDFSDYAAAALCFACELAADLHHRLVVVHVVHDPGETPGLYSGKQTRKRLRRLEELAAEMLDDFLVRMRKEHPRLKALKKAKTRLPVGLPVPRILEVASELMPRTIVMGSQGRSGLAHVLLGSKAEQVARLAEAPVTIVRLDARSEKRARNTQVAEQRR